MSMLFYSCTSPDSKEKEDLETQDRFEIQNVIDTVQYNSHWTAWFPKGQPGTPYISNFVLPENLDKQNWAIISDDDNVMLFTNRKGVLAFDGKEWTEIKTHSFPYVFFKDEKRIYVGCRNAYGYLSKDDDGRYSFIKLSNDSVDVGDINTIQKADDQILFSSNHTLSIRSATDDNAPAKCIRKSSHSSYNGVFVFKDNFYVNTTMFGILKLENDSLVEPNGTGWSPVIPIDNSIVKPLRKSFDLKGYELLFSIPFNQRYILLGTSNNKLFLYDGNGFASYNIEDANYLEDNVITGGIDLSNNEFAVSTLTGGSIIIEKASGKILSKIDHQTGLPDNEIYSLGVDKNKGLWLSHQFGVSRVNFSLPIKKYSDYLGLQGSIFSLIEYDSTIYVTTSEGVYYLTKVEDYKEIEILIKKRRIEKERQKKLVRTRVAGETTGENNQIHYVQNNEVPENPNWFKKRWSKIKRKIKKKDESDILPVENDSIDIPLDIQDATYIEEEVPGEDIVKIKEYTVSEKKYALQAVWHVYKKLSGINGKCGQIRKIAGRLLVASNNGLYEIVDTTVVPILKDVYVNTMCASELPGKIFVGTNSGIYELNYSENQWSVTNISETKAFDFPVFSITEVKQGKELWLGSENKAFNLKLDDNGKSTILGYNFHSEYSERIMVQKVDGEPRFFLNSGIYTYNKANDIIYKLALYPDLIPNPKYLFSQDSITWLSKGGRIVSLPEKDSLSNMFRPYFNIFNNVQDIYTDDQSNIWVVDNYSSIYKITNVDEQLSFDFDLFIKQIANEVGIPYPIVDLKLNHKQNSLKINLAAPAYLKENTTYYQYNIIGLKDEWSNWDLKSSHTIPYIPPGNYTLNVRAKNVLGQISREHYINFEISPPFWRTWWFLLLCLLAVIYSIHVVVKYKQRRLQLENAKLEGKIQERTAELLKQKEQVMDSIQYASRIQKAILPPEEMAVKYLPQHFILNMPREIVSGDYYWFTRRDNKTIVAAADCTGHGVPGAFLSMLGITFLDDIVNKRRIANANEILNNLRSDVMRALHQTGKRGEAKDGMDIALCIIDEKNHTMEYAGAHNPLWIFRKRTEEELKEAFENDDINEYKLIEFKADRMPIGIYLKDRPFRNHEIKLFPGDTFYIFSDGYTDLFGEKTNRKFYLK